MDELFFIIEDDPAGGYTAAALGHSIFTEGETIDEVRRNIREAVACHFGETGGSHLVRLRFVHEESFTCV